MTQAVEPTATHDATTIRELTANEMNSVTGGWINGCTALMMAAQQGTLQALAAQDKMGNFELTSSF